MTPAPHPTYTTAPADSQEAHARLTRCIRYLEQDQTNLRLLAEIADLYLQLGEPANARGYIDLALAEAPSDSHLLSRSGTIALALGRGDEAAEIFRGLLDAGLDIPAIRYNLARALTLISRYEEAKAILGPIASNFTETPDAPALYVRVLHYLGDVKGAIQAAEQQLKANPDDRSLAPMLSTLYMDANDLVASKSWAEKAISADPDNGEALATLGMLEIGEQDEQAAISHLDRAIEISPTSGRAWVGRALGDLLTPNVPAARERLQKAAEYMPSHIGTWHALAWCQILEQDLYGAENSLNIAMAIDHNFGETHGGLAVLSILKGDTVKAQEYVKRAVALDPNSFSARTAQILLLQSQGKTAVAQKMIERILQAPQFRDGKNLQQLVSEFVKKKNPPPGKAQ